MAKQWISVGGMQTSQDTSLYPKVMSTTTMLSSPSQESGDNTSSPVRLYANSVLGLNSTFSPKGRLRVRRKREFIPEEQKDGNYWFKRKRNNEAAKMSRQRRRMEGILLEGRANELLRENEKLRATLSAVQYRAIGVDGGRDKPVDEQHFSTHCFHPASTSVPRAAPWMLPPDVSFGTTFNVSKDVSDNTFTSGFTHNPDFPNVGTCRRTHLNCSDVSHQFHSPDKECFSGAGVPDSYPPVPILNDYQCYRNVGIACNVGHYPSHIFESPSRYSASPNVGISYSVIRTSAQYSNARAHHARDANIEDFANGNTPVDLDRANKVISTDGQSHGTEPCSSEITESGAQAHDRTTTEASDGGTMYLLPHKLRFKANKPLKEQTNLLNRASTDNDNEIKNSGQLCIYNGTRPMRHMDEQEFIQWDCEKESKPNSSRSNVQPEKDKLPQYFASSCSKPLVSKEATTPEIMTSSPATIVSGEMIENGHLRHQLASLCAEVKNLKQIILSKSHRFLD